MKKTLLASVAAAALIAGPAFAQKQEAPASKTEAPARAPAAVQNAPAEKVAPAGKVAPDKAASEQKSPKSETTGQASPSTSKPSAADTKAGDTKADKPAAAPDTKAQTRSGAGAQTGTSTQTQTSTTASGGSVALNTEQKAKIRSTVLTANAPRVTNVNFSIGVGTVVPRSVRLVAVPAPLIEIHPAWRGFMYFVHGDEIIIVEPGTLRIVAIVNV
jgi:uncharacterized protein DUF1236